jgi:hypothetical protein
MKRLIEDIKIKCLFFVLVFTIFVFAKDKADQTMIFLTVKEYFKTYHYLDKPKDAYITEIKSSYKLSFLDNVGAKAKLMIQWENRVEYIHANLKIKVTKNLMGFREYTVVWVKVRNIKK